MTLGIKVGPQQQSINAIQQANPPFAEVWFNILQKQSYNDLFTEMKKRRMQVGLHFWGHTDKNIWTNIAYPDKELIATSLKQIQDTIEIAARHSFEYVNIHPSNYALVSIDFETQTFVLVSKPADPHTCEELFFENAHKLREYANHLGVVLTLETIPPRDHNDWNNSNKRNEPLQLYAPDNSLLVKAATQGFTIANDFGHTACTAMNADRQTVLDTVRTMTKMLAPATRLLHLGFIVPPYNGTDFHDHMDTALFESDNAVPNASEMLQLLDLFKDRSDVWALVEPDGRHVENYVFAKKLFNI